MHRSRLFIRLVFYHTDHAQVQRIAEQAAADIEWDEDREPSPEEEGDGEVL